MMNPLDYRRSWFVVPKQTLHLSLFVILCVIPSIYCSLSTIPEHNVNPLGVYKSNNNLFAVDVSYETQGSEYLLKKLEECIDDVISKKEQHKNDDNDTITSNETKDDVTSKTSIVLVDISNSYLGDDASLNACSNVLLKLSNNTNSSRSSSVPSSDWIRIHMESRMNQLTGRGAAKLFDMMIQKAKEEDVALSNILEEFEKKKEEESLISAAAAALLSTSTNESKSEEKDSTSEDVDTEKDSICEKKEVGDNENDAEEEKETIDDAITTITADEDSTIKDSVCDNTTVIETTAVEQQRQEEFTEMSNDDDKTNNVPTNDDNETTVDTVSNSTLSEEVLVEEEEINDNTTLPIAAETEQEDDDANDVEGEDDENTDETNSQNAINPQPNEELEQNSTTTHEKETQHESEEEEKTPLPSYPCIRMLYVESLDLAFNPLGEGGGGGRAASRLFSKSLRTLIESSVACPRSLRLDRCGIGPAACRAIGKAIIHRSLASTIPTTTNKYHHPTPPRELTSLYLGGNPLIGDAGAVALAAALRTAKRRTNSNPESLSLLPILDVLDLSSCNIGDAGAEALAMAIADSPGCVRRLDLSHNPLLSNDGISAIGRALVKASSSSSASATNTRSKRNKKKGISSSSLNQPPPPTPTSSNGRIMMDDINVSGNKHINEKGASSLAAAMQCGALTSVSMRSCAVHADGAMAFGEAVVAFGLASRSQYSNRHITSSPPPVVLHVDLSGNPLGTLTLKPTPKGVGKYKTLATEKTSKYMNWMGKQMKRGLKDYAGVDMDTLLPGTGDSDDDDVEDMEDYMLEEGEHGDNTAVGKSAALLSSVTRCGARSFADPILNVTGAAGGGSERNTEDGVNCVLNMRKCALDSGAADALAASIIRARERLNVNIQVDVSMNPALVQDDNNVVKALAGGGDEDRDEEDVSLQRIMAKRHLDAMEALRLAAERAAEAAELASERARAEAELNAAWGGGDDYDEFVDDEYNDDEYGAYDRYGNYDDEGY